jgi:hypothetical protein
MSANARNLIASSFLLVLAFPSHILATVIDRLSADNRQNDKQYLGSPAPTDQFQHYCRISRRLYIPIWACLVLIERKLLPLRGL